MSKAGLPTITARMRSKLRGASTKARNKYSIGGRAKTGGNAPKPVTLRNFEKGTN